MATPHNAANIGDIAETILLPGDPLRAKVIAETFLENPVQFNTVRNMFGYTGTYKGKKVSVMGTGMGMPSIGIYSHELIQFYGVKNLIRYQQALAAETHVAFWNLFQAMGGEGSMVEMVNSKPSMANYYYTHINFRGGKHIAGLLFEALMYGKEQHEKRKAYEAE